MKWEPPGACGLMNTKNLDSRAPRRAVAAGVVMLLHLGLLGGAVLALQQARQGARPPEVAEPRVSWLQLLPAPSTAPTPAPRPDLPDAPAKRPDTALRWVAPTPPAAIAAPAPAAPPGPAPAPTPSTEPAPSAEPAPALPAPAPPPLVLTLPRGASAPWRNPALDDPRSASTRPKTLEARLAAVMESGEGPLVEEHLPDGSLRLKRGKNCVVVRPSRTQAIDPFNQSVSPKPRQVDSC
jgi:hypothetical protein